MDNFSQHSNQLHDAFDKFSRKAPDRIWEKLNHDLSSDAIEQTVKEAFSTQNKTAPDKAWIGIKKNLLIDDVWNNIRFELDKRKKRHFFFFFSGAAGLCLIFLITYLANLSTSSEKVLFPAHHLKPHSVINENSLILKGAISLGAGHKNKMIDVEQSFISTRTDNQNRMNYQYSGSLKFDSSFTVSQSDYTTNLQRDSADIHMIYSDPKSMMRFQTVPVLSLNSNLCFPPIELCPPQKNKSDRGIEFGTIASLNNTWIFSEDVKRGFKRYSLVTNDFTLGYDAGFFLNYQFSDKQAVGAEVDLFSQHNQQYSSYSEGSVCNHKISFKQIKTSVYYKHQRKSTWMQNHALTFRGGVYSAYNLKSTFYENDLQSTEKLYEKFDFGMLFSIGSKHQIGKLSFEYGINTSIGLLNLTKNSSTELKKFSYTTSYFTGVYLSFSYRLK